MEESQSLPFMLLDLLEAYSGRVLDAVPPEAIVCTCLSLEYLVSDLTVDDGFRTERSPSSQVLGEPDLALSG
jgi:hypothetical protein